MASPLAPVAIDGSCSVIDGTTLFVYSPTAFLSLPLQKGGKWSELRNGLAVTGASCVFGPGTGSGGGDALWIVGGVTSTGNYTGLQRYSFTSKSWDIVTPVVRVTQNRHGHAATYLSDSGSILVYGGSQMENGTPSTETFTISAFAPFGVQSYTSHNDPAYGPLLLPWDGSNAVTLGGQSSSNIFRFTVNVGWSQFPIGIGGSLKSIQQEQAALFQGSSGSKVLALFDMSVSPNNCSQVVLQGNSGSSTPHSSNHSRHGPRGVKRKRTAVDGLPQYSNKNAPTVTRNGFSIAQSSGGLVALTGGSQQDPVALFDFNQNSWVDGQQFFGAKDIQSVLQPTSTRSSQNTISTSHATSTTATATSSALPPPPSDNGHPRTSLILGAALGAILGFIALLIILLLCIRWRRRKRKRQEDDDQRRLSFADRGAPFMREAGGAASTDDLAKPRSLAHMIDATGQPRGHRRTATHDSDSSTARLVPKKPVGIAMKDAVEMAPIREISTNSLPNHALPNKGNLLATPNRSSGWSRYFSGPEAAAAVDGAGSSRGSARTPRSSTIAGLARKSLSRKSNTSQVSMLTTSTHDCSSHGPTEIPPLNLGQYFDTGRVTSLAAGTTYNPTAGDRRPDTSYSHSSRFPVRPGTMSSGRSSSRAPSSFSDGVFSHDAAIDEASSTWTPVTRSDWTPSFSHTSGAPGGVSKHRDTATSFYDDSSSSGHLSIVPGIPTAAVPTRTVRMVSGASVERPSSATVWRESGARYPAPAKAHGQIPPVQDLSWVELGPLNGTGGGQR